MKGELQMIEQIIKRIWSLSPRVDEHASYHALSRLTQDLIKHYDSQGRLFSNPFNPSRERFLSLPFQQINNLLKDSICLVTGGLGCVGTTLVTELLKFDIKSIIILDIKQNDVINGSTRVINVKCDIRDGENMQKIFKIHKPDIVFHTAAQRDPGIAELQIEETVSTNVLGTLNVVDACESSHSVKQLISASTGKASRYFTEEVYAATKKLTEFILEGRARTSKIKYAMVRFTHILDNSLMNEALKEASLNNNYISVHSPGKYVTAQNAKEAAHLMLNALIYTQEKQCKFLLVRHLEWPVESLEMALFYVKQSGLKKPIIFEGNPMGYAEKFFRGQLDWSNPSEMNLLINVYEKKHAYFNNEEDIIISIPCTTDTEVLQQSLGEIRKSTGECATKKVLVQALRSVVQASLKHVDKTDTLNILQWGTDAGFMEMEKTKISDFDYLVPLFTESLQLRDLNTLDIESLESKPVYAAY